MNTFSPYCLLLCPPTSPCLGPFLKRKNAAEPTKWRPREAGVAIAIHYVRENKGGWKTQGRGKHTIKPLPKHGFGPPPPVIRFPPPVCFRPVVFLRGNRHRPGKPHFLRPPKLALEGALYGTFPPPPPKIARYVLPPH